MDHEAGATTRRCTRGGSALRKRRLHRWQARSCAYSWVLLVLALVLSPHLGLLLLSLSKVWSFSVLPDGYTLDNFMLGVHRFAGMIGNTLLYCALAAGLDVVLGTAIAYLILRTRLPGRQWLDWLATAAIAIPGIVLASAFCAHSAACNCRSSAAAHSVLARSS